MLDLAFTSASDFWSDVQFNELTTRTVKNTVHVYCGVTKLRIGKFNLRNNTGFIKYDEEIYGTPFEYTLRSK